MLAEDEVDLWKCATIDLVSDEEDTGCPDGLCYPVLWQLGAHQALCHAAVENGGDTEVQGRAPETSAKSTKFRQNAASYLQL